MTCSIRHSGTGPIALFFLLFILLDSPILGSFTATLWFRPVTNPSPKKDKPHHQGPTFQLFLKTSAQVFFFFYVPFRLIRKGEGDKTNCLQCVMSPPNDAIIRTTHKIRSKVTHDLNRFFLVFFPAEIQYWNPFYTVDNPHLAWFFACQLM